MSVILHSGPHAPMFFSSKVLQINDWTDKIKKNLYNKHSVAYMVKHKQPNILNMFI